MKKFIKSSAVLFATVLLATGAFAADKAPKDSVNKEVKAWASVNYFDKSCGVDVAIQNIDPSNATLTIYDSEGNVLLTDELKSNDETIKKSYLLTDVSVGDYTIEVTSNNKVVEKTIELRNDESNDQIYAL